MTVINKIEEMKNLIGWESRYYFIDEELKYHKHKGFNNIKEKPNTSSILNVARKILKYANEQVIMK